MSRILSPTTFSGSYTLPAIMLDVHDARKTARAAWSACRVLLPDRIALRVHVYRLMTGPVYERRQRSPMATGGSWWVAPVLWVHSLPLWAVVGFIGWL